MRHIQIRHGTYGLGCGSGHVHQTAEVRQWVDAVGGGGGDLLLSASLVVFILAQAKYAPLQII